MSIAEPISSKPEHHAEVIAVTVSYLPAAAPFHHRYDDETLVEKVRTDAMAFFGVHDHQERNTYTYYLELGGHRITNTSQTLGHLAAEHHHQDELHFHLVEEITPGSE